MKKFLTILGLLTVIATPAFAQNFTGTWGTGNVLPSYYDANGHLVQGIAPQAAARANGADAFAMAPGGTTNADDAFAMAPGGTTNADPYSPANNGGGSEGYNWSVAHDF
jgi:hypothetical protein